MRAQHANNVSSRSRERHGSAMLPLLLLASALAACPRVQTLPPAARHPLPFCLRLRGAGYAYQAPGRRPYVERHTPGQVDSRDVPHMLELEIDPGFDVDKQPWYTGTVENVKEFWGAAGPPPLPDDVPEIVKLALGDRINRPINVEIAISWVLATDPRLKERLSRPEETTARPQLCQICLGPDPSRVNVVRCAFQGYCKICALEYTEWQFRPKSADVRIKVRTKKTVVCLRCAKEKDVCQVCIFDMKYGLPVKLRDKLVARTGGVLPSWAARLLPAPPQYLQDKTDIAASHDNTTESDAAALFARRVQKMTEKLCHQDVPLPVLPASLLREQRKKATDAAIANRALIKAPPHQPLTTIEGTASTDIHLPPPAAELKAMGRQPLPPPLPVSDGVSAASTTAVPGGHQVHEVTESSMEDGAPGKLGGEEGPGKAVVTERCGNDHVAIGNFLFDEQRMVVRADGCRVGSEAARGVMHEALAQGRKLSQWAVWGRARLSSGSGEMGEMDGDEQAGRAREGEEVFAHEESDELVAGRTDEAEQQVVEIAGEVDEDRVTAAEKTGREDGDGVDKQELPPATARFVKRLLTQRQGWQEKYQRNRAKICTFWMRGACERGAFCPFRHEKPMPSEMVQLGLVPGVKPLNHEEAIKTRYYGHGADAVATDILKDVVNQGGARDDGGASGGRERCEGLPAVLQKMLESGGASSMGEADRGEGAAGDNRLQESRGRRESRRGGDVGGFGKADVVVGAGGMKAERRGSTLVIARWDGGAGRRDASVDDRQLRKSLSTYGEVSSLRAVKERGMAFVKFSSVAAADRVMRAASRSPGLFVGNSKLTLSRS